MLTARGLPRVAVSRACRSRSAARRAPRGARSKVAPAPTALERRRATRGLISCARIAVGWFAAVVALAATRVAAAALAIGRIAAALAIGRIAAAVAVAVARL